MSIRITVQVDEMPEVEVIDEYTIMVDDWSFDSRDGIVSAQDVAAWARAKEYFEQHPELVPDE